MGIKNNNIRQLRHKLGLTQQQLADLVGTSQQQIQRVEVGQYAKLELATQICGALKSPLEQVFPSTKKIITRLGKKNPPKKEEIDRALNEAGIDVDPVHWSIRFRLKNGLEGVWDLSSKDKDRLVSISQDPNQIFFCALSGNREIAVNMRHLVFFQPCFDVGIIEHEEKRLDKVHVYLKDSADPLGFGVDPDEERESEGENNGEFQSLLFSLELYDGDSDVDPMISFIDEDGERAFFRTEQIALVEIPLWVTNPQIEDDNDKES